MNFKQWLENSEESTVVFLDLDETLVSTHKLPSNPKNADLMRSIGGVQIQDSYISFLRPHAIDFVNNLKSIARVCIITAGSGSFQKNVIHALKIPINDSDIFGFEDYDISVHRPSENKLPKSKNSVLVDDLNYDEPKTMEKLHAIGIDEDKHIKVSPFKLDPIIATRFPNVFKNDDELLKIEPKVVNILRK